MNTETAWAMLATPLPRETYAVLLDDIDVDGLIASVEVPRSKWSDTRRRPVTAAAFELLLDTIPVPAGKKLARRVTVADGSHALILLRQDRAGLQSEATLDVATFRAAVDHDLETGEDLSSRVSELVERLDSSDKWSLLQKVGPSFASSRYLAARESGKRGVVFMLERYLYSLLTGTDIIEAGNLPVAHGMVRLLLDDLAADVSYSALASERDRIVKLWRDQLDEAEHDIARTCTAELPDMPADDVLARQRAELADDDALAAELADQPWMLKTLAGDNPSGLVGHHFAAQVDAVADGTSTLEPELQAEIAAASFPRRAGAWVDAGQDPAGRDPLVALAAAIVGHTDHVGIEDLAQWPERLQRYHLSADRQEALTHALTVGAVLVDAGLHDRHETLHAAVEILYAAVDSGALTVEAASDLREAVDILVEAAAAVGHLDPVAGDLEVLTAALDDIVASDPLAGAFEQAAAAAQTGDPTGFVALKERSASYLNARLDDLEADAVHQMRRELFRAATDSPQRAFALTLGSADRTQRTRAAFAGKAAVQIASDALAEADAGDTGLLTLLLETVDVPTDFDVDELTAMIGHVPAGGLKLLARHPASVQEQVVERVGDVIEGLAVDNGHVAAAALKCKASRWRDLAVLLSEVRLGRSGNAVAGMHVIGPVLQDRGGVAAIQTVSILLDGWVGTWASLRDAALSLAGADEETLRAVAAERRLAAAA